ncbi:cytochrome P450 [Apodospora peruviana]|uniref:Cytochrome P450 n=1 Tax=Apodospora peruviana TaxID=516989 RepID=A0AAE0HVC3_9PEZI|nr:cytochrome P450 [Apodospora peruviana]
MASTFSVVVGCLAATYLFLPVLLHMTQDAREPPAILTGVPFIGPIFSMTREKFRFCVRLRDQYRLPIYTLRLPISRIYVVKATEAIPKLDIMQKDLMSEDGFRVSWPKHIMPAMSPGADLDHINRKSVQIYVNEMERLQASNGTTRVGLAEWAREMMVTSTGEAIWGPQNPLRDPKYTKTGGYKTASGLVRKRWEHHHDLFVFNEEDFGRGEIGNAFAVLGNTTATTFWVTYHIYKDDQILADVRRELSALVREGEEDGVKTSTIDLAVIKDGCCPILMSTFQEVLRYRAVSNSTCCSTTAVCFAKGSTLMMPGPVQHSETSDWGEDAVQFDYLRFIRKREPGKKRFNRVAFRSFGGGHTLCPGRNFATTEIVSLAALLVLQFDVTPVGGKWVDPTFENSPIAAGFPHPDKDIDKVLFSGDKAMNIVAEDIAAAE